MPDEKDLELENAAILYHDMHFVTDYIADGIREDELHTVLHLFKGKRVKVHIDITEV